MGAALQRDRSLPRSRWRELKVVWYERLRPVWLDLRPLVLALLTVAVFVLGTIGFQRYQALHGRTGSVLDSFYRTLTLFELDGFDVEPPIPWPMEVARFLAPLLVGYAIFRGVVSVFRDQLRLAGIRLLTRNHVVVAGLGGIGLRLASAFRAKGFRVIALEADTGAGAVHSAHEQGITVLAGDARDRRMLAKARAGHARYLVAACGEDGRNVEVAVAAGQLARERAAGVLHAFVHLDDFGLWRMMKAESITRLGHRAMRIEFFNTFESAARILLDEHPPFSPIPAARSPRRPHLLLAGLDGIGEALVLNIARLWQSSRPAPAEELHLTILAPDAAAAQARLLERYPELERICNLRALALPLGVELQLADLGGEARGAPPPSGVYVCIARETQALQAALALRARAELRHVAFAVAVSDAGAGLAAILREDAGTGPGMYGFGVLGRALRVAALVRGTNEALARAKHEEYVRHELARGQTLGTGLLVSWEQLDEQWKDANRAFADGIGAHLERAGCALVPAPLIDPWGPLFSFTAEEIEPLARAEHDRWVAEKVRNGWRHGPVRDDARRLHPLLVEWEQLPEVERDKDREPVREIPRMLAHAGFEIIRLADGAPVGQDAGGALPAFASGKARAREPVA